VDRQRLPAAARGPGPDRRLGRRPLWSAQSVRCRRRPVRRRFAGLRRVAQCRAADPGPRGPGHGRRLRGPGQPGHIGRDLRREGTRRGDRSLGGLRRGDHRHRPGSGRLAGRRCLVARDLPDQPADRGGHHRVGPVRDSREPRPRCRSSRLARRRSGRDGSRRDDLGSDGGRRARLGQPGGLERPGGGRDPAGRLPRQPGAPEASDDAVVSVQIEDLQRRQPADPGALFRPDRRPTASPSPATSAAGSRR
jgi:hypothetical protein